MRGQLLVIAGPDQGRTFTLEEGQTLVIGRGQNTVTKLKDAQVSRVHCEVRLAGGRLRLTDSGSSSGTLVDDRRVVQHDFAPGEAFQIGATCIRFELECEAEASTVVVSGSLPALLAAHLAETHYKHLKTHFGQGVLVLALTESQILDEELAEAVRVEMFRAVGQSNAPKVVLDFHAVTSVSSAVFRPLLSLRGRVQEHGGRLVLCGLTAMPAQVLRMSGMIDGPAPGEGFDTAADVAAAAARLQGAG